MSFLPETGARQCNLSLHVVGGRLDALAAAATDVCARLAADAPDATCTDLPAGALPFSAMASVVLSPGGGPTDRDNGLHWGAPDPPDAPPCAAVVEAVAAQRVRWLAGEGTVVTVARDGAAAAVDVSGGAAAVAAPSGFTAVVVQDNPGHCVGAHALAYCWLHGDHSRRCVEALLREAAAAHAAARAGALLARPPAPAPAAPADPSPLRVHVWPRAEGAGLVREHDAVAEGLRSSRRAVTVAAAAEADVVFFLAGGETLALPREDKVPPSKLVVLDYGDVPWLLEGVESPRDCRLYFKRSWVVKQDGRLVASPFVDIPWVRPLAFGVLDAYVGQGPVVSYADRSRYAVVCTLRPGNPVRARVLGWVTQFVVRRALPAFVGQIGDGLRATSDSSYYALMRSARIVVTANPGGYDGDHRLWESFASGALVLTDRLHVPLGPAAPVPGVHFVLYDTHNRTDLEAKVLHYLAAPAEAARIADAGRELALAAHRMVDRVDGQVVGEVLRTPDSGLRTPGYQY